MRSLLKKFFFASLRPYDESSSNLDNSSLPADSGNLYLQSLNFVDRLFLIDWSLKCLYWCHSGHLVCNIIVQKMVLGDVILLHFICIISLDTFINQSCLRLIHYHESHADSYDAKLAIMEGESIYDFCWYPFMSASSTLFKWFHL